jgi:hypothetical protein
MKVFLLARSAVRHGSNISLFDRSTTMTPSLEFARAAVLSLAVGLIGISAAAAGEGSADTGPPPPYGYYAGERGPPPGNYGRYAPYGSPAQRQGRAVQQPRSRR